MSLKSFFPFPQTRFIQAGAWIYKLKIRGSNSGENMEGNLNQELEDMIRTVLGNLESLQPFCTAHFKIFPCIHHYKKQWEHLPKVMCKHTKKNLRVYPFVLILYLEENSQNAEQTERKLNKAKVRVQQHTAFEPQSKRCKMDSPLEEAMLKDLVMDMEAESKGALMGLYLDSPHSEGEAIGQADKCLQQNKTEGSDKPQLRADINMKTRSVTPGEMQPGTLQDKGEEEGQIAEPGWSGILTRLARRMFPFSLFFRRS